MNFRERCRLRLFGVRLLEALGCTFLGGAVLFSLSWLEGLPWVAPSLLGAGGALALALVRRPPWADPAREIDPGRDEDGLLRAILEVGEEHPFAGDLERQAASRAVHFRPLGELRPLALLAAAALFSAFWVRSAPAGSTVLSREGGGDAPGVAPAGAAQGATPEIPLGARKHPGREPIQQPPGGLPLQQGGRKPEKAQAGETGGKWVQVPVRPLEGGAFRSGRDSGPFRVYLERYLRLKAEERK
ncbi:MAG: hypothetical protein ACE5H3_03020 [Planctomycetota bacterium]